MGRVPAGSPALAEARRWIIAQLKQTGAQVEEDSFTASTPVGAIPMTNLIAKFPGDPIQSGDGDGPLRHQASLTTSVLSAPMTGRQAPRCCWNWRANCKARKHALDLLAGFL